MEHGLTQVRMLVAVFAPPLPDGTTLGGALDCSLVFKQTRSSVIVCLCAL